MPVHTHPVNDLGHSHDMGIPTRGQVWGVRSDNVQYCYGVDNGGATNNPPTLQVQTGVSIQSVGGGVPHNNVQPSIAIRQNTRSSTANKTQSTIDCFFIYYCLTIFFEYKVFQEDIGNALLSIFLKQNFLSVVPEERLKLRVESHTNDRFFDKKKLIYVPWEQREVLRL